MKSKFSRISVVFLSAAFGLALVLAGIARAGNPAVEVDVADSSETAAMSNYIVILEDMPVAMYDGGLGRMAATAPSVTGRAIDAESSAVQAYGAYLASRRASVIGRAEGVIGRDLELIAEFGVVANGFAAQMTAAEAAQIARMDNVWMVEEEQMYELQTDAGPSFVGAPSIWGADDDALSYVAYVNGSNQTTPVTSTVTAMGAMSYDFTTNALTYTVEISNPSNISLTMMHIHTGTAGVDGGVSYDFGLTPTDNTIVSLSGAITLNDAQEIALANDGLYINIHSEDNPGGEARGQIELDGTLGEGVIVGIFDTGIDPFNPSFLAMGADGYIHTNPYTQYLGVCDPAITDTYSVGTLVGSFTGVVAYDETFPCNDKLIGVWGYTGSDPNPRDTDGHGSHTAGTSAGNFVEEAVLATDSQVLTTSISGVAPHANIIAYDVCIDDGGCPGIPTIMAQNQAMLDGVDVVNYSIGGGRSNPWGGALEFTWLVMRDAGVIVATSAGNSGPGDGTLGYAGDLPWVTSVGANTHDRAFLNSITLIDGTGNYTGGVTIDGRSFTGSLITPTEVVLAADYASVITGTADDARLCAPGAFPAGTFSGEIVVCERGSYGRVAKGQSVADGGAGGYILAQPDEVGGGPGAIAADPHVLPAVHITYDGYQEMLQFMTDTMDVSGTVVGIIAGTTLDVDESYGNIMTSFSSRGPNLTTGLQDIVVPKVTAPGRDIIAAYFQGPMGDNDPTWNAISGTSMSSPHVAGAAALMVALHPDWSPAEIESALMTTARTNVLNDDGVNPATPFAQGSGHIDLTVAGNAGLVLDVTGAEYNAANPAAGGSPRDLNLASMGDAACVSSCTWTRVVSSTLSVTETWSAAVVDITGTVSPADFELGPGEVQTLTIEVDLAGLPIDGEWLFGELQLTAMGETPDAHMPIAVQAAASTFGDAYFVPAASPTGTYTITPVKAIEITEMALAVAGLEPATMFRGTLGQDSTNGDPYDDLSETYWVTMTVPTDTARLVAEVTVAGPGGGTDFDLFWGAGDMPSAATQLGISASATGFEYLSAANPPAGTYWVLLQNWASVGEFDNFSLAVAAVPNADAGNMEVTGPAMVTAGTDFGLEVTYSGLDTSVDRHYSVVTVGTDAGNPDNLGVFDLDIGYSPFVGTTYLPITLKE